MPYHGMPPLEGALWNVMSDRWEFPDEIIRRIPPLRSMNSSQLYSALERMGQNGRIERTLSGRSYAYRLPQPIDSP